MKRHIWLLVGVFVAFFLCMNVGPARAERYADIDGQTLVDTETGAIWERVDAARDEAIVQLAIIKGTWRGSYTSYSGWSGAVTVRIIQQSGPKLSGNMDVARTDCVPSNLYKMPFTGIINALNVITITAKRYCSGDLVTLKYTKGRVINGWLKGTYVVLVNGGVYDSGTFKLKKIIR